MNFFLIKFFSDGFFFDNNFLRFFFKEIFDHYLFFFLIQKKIGQLYKILKNENNRFFCTTWKLLLDVFYNLIDSWWYHINHRSGKLFVKLFKWI